MEACDDKQQLQVSNFAVCLGWSQAGNLVIANSDW